jgi:hypothetical protein
MKIHWGPVSLDMVWLNPPTTFILGWSVKRRGYWSCDEFWIPPRTVWKLWPGWCITVWAGLWNLTLETSDEHSTVSDGRGSCNVIRIR